MIKPWRMTTMIAIGMLVGLTLGVYIGYKLPRKETVNVSVGEIKAKKGSEINLDMDATVKEPQSRAEKRREKRGK